MVKKKGEKLCKICKKVLTGKAAEYCCKKCKSLGMKATKKKNICEFC